MTGMTPEYKFLTDTEIKALPHINKIIEELGGEYNISFKLNMSDCILDLQISNK